jgi:hypothetical protein
MQDHNKVIYLTACNVNNFAIVDDTHPGGKMGSEWILGRLAWGGVDWIRLAQDRDRWRAVVSAVMNLRVLAPWS